MESPDASQRHSAAGFPRIMESSGLLIQQEYMPLPFELGLQNEPTEAFDSTNNAIRQTYGERHCPRLSRGSHSAEHCRQDGAGPVFRPSAA
jgi:hypothetical protein